MILRPVMCIHDPNAATAGQDFIAAAAVRQMHTIPQARYAEFIRTDATSLKRELNVPL